MPLAELLARRARGGLLVHGVLVLAVAACTGQAPPGTPSPSAETPLAPATPSPSASVQPSDPAADNRRELQAAIERFSADIDQYWTLAFPAVYHAPYKPISELIAYEGRADAPVCNGHRLRSGNAYYCEAGDYIAWDEPGLLLPMYVEAGDFAVAFVLAHEWGHAVGSRASANLPANVFGELQADCFAGAYAAWADQNGTLDAGDLDEAVFAMYRVRDAAGTPWLDPDAHGSSLDRIRSFSVGLDEGPAKCANYSLPEPPDTPPG